MPTRHDTVLVKYILFNSGLLLLLCFTVLFPGSASPVYQALLKIPSNSFVSCSNFSLQCAFFFFFFYVNVVIVCPYLSHVLL